MSKKFLYGVVAASLMLTFACKQEKKNSFAISGSYTNADKLKAPGSALVVYLEEIQLGKDQPPVVLDSARLSENTGSFSLKASVKTQEIIELVFGDNALAIPLINDAPEIKLTVDLGRKDDFYTVNGSEASSQLRDLLSNLGKKSFQIDKSFAALDSLKQLNMPDSIMILATKEKNNAILEMNSYLKGFIRKSDNPILSILALGWARSFSKEEFETSLNELVKKYPDNVVLQNMKKEFVLQESQAVQQPTQPADNNWVGKPAPELALPDKDGKTISLSSFRGKYVLVDFWASWCGPCRQENPNVVEAYHQFKNKNFTVLGVSLDKEKDAWQKAISDDQLTWTHISDLKFWNSSAVDIFKFEGIPFNVLVDPKGTIIAQELRGPALEAKLQEVLQ